MAVDGIAPGVVAMLRGRLGGGEQAARAADVVASGAWRRVGAVERLSDPTGVLRHGVELPGGPDQHRPGRSGDERSVVTTAVGAVRAGTAVVRETAPR